ncbi:hypothetical protein [Breoghania sp.]|uniref:hypothetical protein n=1 Tax=Breoghania sp. TaxID=2065378 RepID=UPI00260C006E|nr:hypothetical protein [Breoghania sp.]MDJ0931510.1 hypothetical protein [Breoghania sp.]
MASLPPVRWLASGDFALHDNEIENNRILAKIGIELPPITEAELADIVAFLNSLTGETALQRPLGRPGLPVD